MKTLIKFAAPIALMVCFNLSGSSVAIEIDKSNRIENPSPGYCAYCSLEMLARQHNVDAIVGLVARRQQIRFYRNDKWIEDGGAIVPDDLTNELDEAKVRYWKQSRGNKDVGILIRVTDKDYGCVVSLKNYPNKDDHHAVVMLNFGKEVSFLDPNHIDQIRSVSRDWFISHWSGGALAITTDHGNGPPPVPKVKNERTRTNKDASSGPTVDSGPVIKPEPIVKPEPVAVYKLAPIWSIADFQGHTGDSHSGFIYKSKIVPPAR